MRQTEQSMGVHPDRQALEQALRDAIPEKGYRPDRTRQAAIFDRMDWATLKTEVLREGSEGKQVRGKLFEMFIQNDPEFGQRSPLEKELLALAHNPDAFGLGRELGYHRNPDLAFLIVQKNDSIVIEGVGESKLGLLNERSFKQLSETGFAAGVKALVDVVNTLSDPAMYNLVEVARARDALPKGTPLLTISPEFSQLLVVPANRNIEWKSSLINRREFSVEGRKKFYDLLTDTRHVHTARAAFSTSEVSAMSQALMRG